MITRERLKELAKKCIPVYAVTRRDVFKIETSDPKIGFIGNFINWVVELNGMSRRLNAHLNDIYETKEDADFALEFQNITRTETLNLPTWEELNKKVDTIPNMFWQIAKCSEFILFLQTDKILNNTQIILRGNDDTYNWCLTKENYLEACKIAKKLFLGEG